MLQDAGILITLTLTQWQARKLDKNISLEICQNKGAKADSGNFHKMLISRQHLQPITQLVNKIRNYHYANTLAWSHKGIDFLPSKHYLTYMDNMGTLKDKFEMAVDKFIKEYPELIKEASVDLNFMHNSDDYPSAEAVRDRFFMDIAATPVPSSGDFRVDIGTEELNKLKDKLDISLKKAEHAAALDLYSRFYTSVAKVVVTLADPYKIFRNTLIFNVEDIATKIKTMDITNDAILQALAVDAHRVCKDLEIEDLRTVNAYRNSTNTNFKKLLASVEKAYEAFESKK